ncbi:unnamed protein product, partial [Hymenolepis diminuta]
FVNEKTCRGWFSAGGFKKDDFSQKDEPRVGCSRILNSEQLQVAIDENPTCTTRELSETFHITHITICREMKRFGWKCHRLGNGSHMICWKSTVCDLLCFTAFS